MVKRIGILAMQGAFAEHGKALARIGADPIEVRLGNQLENLDGLIIPGGESTTIGQIADEWHLIEPLRAFGRSGKPMWGTCAGMILMANDVLDGVPGQPLLRLMDIVVRRHAFGRQVESFETALEVPALGQSRYRAVFIRAPLIEHIGPGVEAMARLEDGRIVAAQQGHLLVTAFHPELTADDRFHEYFVRLTETDEKELRLGSRSPK
jgi:5'-phosphate synthase pdxT subunit